MPQAAGNRSGRVRKKVMLCLSVTQPELIKLSKIEPDVVRSLAACRILSLIAGTLIDPVGVDTSKNLMEEGQLRKRAVMAQGPVIFCSLSLIY